jgi:hypothetical protein
MTKAELEAAVEAGQDLTGTDLHFINLRYADLRNAHLTDANLTGANLTRADLRYAYLHEAHLTGANLRYAYLHEADLTGANLSGARLTGASFSGARLRGAKLPPAPVIPRIHQAVYQAASQPDALDMRYWHTCKTTHCRAGWVVTLAGKAGKDLERRIGTDAAATLIYMASDPDLEQIPDWWVTNKAALEDMRRLAETEKDCP